MRELSLLSALFVLSVIPCPNPTILSILNPIFLPPNLGERAWLKVRENYVARKRLAEYRLAHGGRYPPDPRHIALLKRMAPFLFHIRMPENESLVIGQEMEVRMRREIAMERGQSATSKKI